MYYITPGLRQNLVHKQENESAITKERLFVICSVCFEGFLKSKGCPSGCCSFGELGPLCLYVAVDWAPTRVFFFCFFGWEEEARWCWPGLLGCSCTVCLSVLVIGGHAEFTLASLTLLACSSNVCPSSPVCIAMFAGIFLNTLELLRCPQHISTWPVYGKSQVVFLSTSLFMMIAVIKWQDQNVFACSSGCSEQ